MGNTSIFDSKIFNAEVFEGYVDRIPNPRKTELVKSRAIRPRPDLAGAMADQDGGNYITTTLRGLINNAQAQNYDGSTDIVGNDTSTFSHSRVVVGRACAWTEKDFSYDITGGEDFIENVAEQVGEYWDEVDQDTIVHVLNGVFNMRDAAGLDFVNAHTHNVCAVTNKEGAVGQMDATTLNTAMQRACGDNKGAFSLVIMHSSVATNLENLKILTYLKFNDANGMEREVGLATLNGRLVLIDDSMPVTENEVSAGTAGVYTVTVGGTPAAGDILEVDGVSVTLNDTTAATPTAAATALADAFKNSAKYAVTRSAAVLTLTEKTGSYGSGQPVCEATSEAATLTAATTTAGVAPTSAQTFITYVLGDGAIEYTNCGAKVPYEVDRDPAINGGQDTLYSRQRKCFAPYGISFTKYNMKTLSPTDAELEDGKNWELVNTGGASDREYISHKTIPIARIISLG